MRESGNNNVECELELESGDVVDVRVSRQFERLFEPSDLSEHLVFPIGAYTFTSTSAGYYSDGSRRWRFDGEATAGDLYDATTRQLGGDTWFAFNRHLRASSGYIAVAIASEYGDLNWRLWSVRLDYVHSATLSASGFLQYSSSNSAKVLNLRIRWILRNDSDLYLVYNDRRQDLAAAPSLRNREPALKVNYRLFI